MPLTIKGAHHEREEAYGLAGTDGFDDHGRLGVGFADFDRRGRFWHGHRGQNDVALNQRPEGQWDIIDEEIARRMGDDVKVKAYYAMDARVKDTLAHIASALDDLRANAAGLPLGKLETLVSNVDDEDWAENWKKQYKPFRLGGTWSSKPGWETFDAQPDDKIIEIDPAWPLAPARMRPPACAWS